MAGNGGQIAQCDCPVQVNEFAKRDLFDGLKLFRELLVEDLPGFGTETGFRGFRRRLPGVLRFPGGRSGEVLSRGGSGQLADETDCAVYSM